MGTQVVSFSSAPPCGTIPAHYRQEDADSESTFGVGASFHAPTSVMMDDLVGRLRENPKVWAVVASEEQDGLSVWTYVDSAEDKDLLPVYEAEWELMKSYPDAAFDFNTVLLPAGGERFDSARLTYAYRR